MKFSSIFLAITANAYNELKVTVASHSQYQVFMPGNSAPIDGPNDWFRVVSYKTNLTGTGPWVLGIIGTGSGVVSGMFAGVTLNGIPYSATGLADTEIKATVTQPASDWLSWTYDASSWEPARAKADCSTALWDKASNGAFTNRLKNQMPLQPMNASWLPSCSTTRNKVFFRMVVYPQRCDLLTVMKNEAWADYSTCKSSKPSNYLTEASGCPFKYQIYSVTFDAWIGGDCHISHPTAQWNKFFP